MTVVHSGPAAVTAELMRHPEIDLKLADSGVDLLFFALSRPNSVVLVDFASAKLCGLALMQELWGMGHRYAIYTLAGRNANPQVKVFSNSLDISCNRGMLIRDLVEKALEENNGRGTGTEARVQPL